MTVADDISMFDDVSLALLGHLAEQKTIFLITTARTGEPVPDLVTGMWRDGRLERVDLTDLSRMHFDTLLHLALGGPIEAGARPGDLGDHQRQSAVRAGAGAGCP